MNLENEKTLGKF